MKKATEFFLGALLGLGLTFSYSILVALLPETLSDQTFRRMWVWAFGMVASYSTYTWITIHKPVPPALSWTFRSKQSISVLLFVFILMGFAILFPSPGHHHLDMLYIVAVAVIGEEILFRGLLWNLIQDVGNDKVSPGRSNTIWLTSLAFGVMHLQYHHFEIHLASVFQVFYSFGFGLLLGAIRKGTKSVIPPMIAHSAFNSIFNLLLVIS